MKERERKSESIRVRVSKKLKQAVRQLARDQDVSEAYVLREAMRQLLRKYRNKRRKIERGLLLIASTATMIFVFETSAPHHIFVQAIPFLVILLIHFVLHCPALTRMPERRP